MCVRPWNRLKNKSHLDNDLKIVNFDLTITYDGNYCHFCDKLVLL